MSEEEEPEDVPVPVLRRSTRENQKRNYLGDWVFTAAGLQKEPQTVEEAMGSAEKEWWKAATQKEMESIYIYSNDVWDLVELPNNRRPVGCKWVFKRKTKANGSIERYKARLVARGFS